MLYLERPLRDRAHLRDLRGALLIQRLEGSRPHGRLCTLNRSERVQGDQVPAELGRMFGLTLRWFSEIPQGGVSPGPKGQPTEQSAPDGTRDSYTLRNACSDREFKWSFMLRTGLVVAVTEA